MNDTPACLLVDDLEENLFAQEALLRETGARIYKARCGDEALELLLADEFAVALIDVQMPGMDGLELAETMRGIERTRNIPIIFVTAVKQDEARVLRGYDRGGAVDFVYKPVAPDVVRSKVRVFLELARQRREVKVQLERAERALAEAEAARAALVEANKLRDRLLAIVSHDLRTPLSVITLTAQLLAAGELPAAEHRKVKRIERSAQGMAGMIEKLLDFSRAHQAGGFPLERTSMDLAETCRQAISELELVNQDATIELRSCGPARGHWDPRALSQAVSNLVANAIQHGGGSAVSVVLSRRMSRVVLEVKNAGPPIPLELMPQIFEPYRKGPPDGSKGLGLGLFIVREIARAHGGTLDVQSTEATGTTFTMELPET